VISRRRLLALTAGAVLSAGVATTTARTRQGRRDGHVSATFKAPRQKVAPGQQPLGLGEASGRDGLLIVPANYRPESAAPLLVLLHGASGSARRVTSLFSVADELGIIVLAPESRDRTWDAIRGEFGPDIDFLNRALTHTFDCCAVDKRRLAIGGFSDGASYGLSVGLASGDLFTHIVACSPGFVIPGPTRGKPRIFMSHGTADKILPIDTTSRRIVPELKRAGYQITYREFEGPHTVTPAISREALEWFRGAPVP
jgi:phospholipase/carboxylesterase